MADAAVSRAVQNTFFAPAWLPPGGRGNGLAARAWAPIADLEASIVDTVLEILGDVGVPAYAARAPRPVRPLLPERPADAAWRIWVGSTSYARAEHALLTCLPSLLHPEKPSPYPVPHRRPRAGRRRGRAQSG